MKKDISTSLKQIQTNIKKLEDHYNEIGTDQDTRANRLASKNLMVESTNKLRQTTKEIKKYS